MGLIMACMYFAYTFVYLCTGVYTVCTFLLSFLRVGSGSSCGPWILRHNLLTVDLLSWESGWCRTSRVWIKMQTFNVNWLKCVKSVFNPIQFSPHTALGSSTASVGCHQAGGGSRHLSLFLHPDGVARVQLVSSDELSGHEARSPHARIYSITSGL